MVWGQVKKEPVVREPNNTTETPALIADLSIRGVWMPQELTLLDVRVIDTDAKSYGNRSPEDVIKTAEREKRNKYGEACEARRAKFTGDGATPSFLHMFFPTFLSIYLLFSSQSVAPAFPLLHLRKHRRAKFTPFCVSVDGVMGKQAQHFVKRIGDRLTDKWDRTYGETMGWLREDHEQNGDV